MMHLADLPERIRLKIDDASGCWIWMGAKGGGHPGDRYGLVKLQGKLRLAHRVVFELLSGPIPEGLTLDHLCRTRLCVNPVHLEPVSLKENILRGKGVTAVNAAKTACVNGHEFTPENTYRHKIGRGCRACIDANARAYRERRRKVGAPDAILVNDESRTN